MLIRFHKYLNRRSPLPEGCVCNLSIKAADYATTLVPEQGDFNAAVITHGDHARVRAETCPPITAVNYDNQLGGLEGADPTTAPGGGSIFIHK